MLTARDVLDSGPLLEWERSVFEVTDSRGDGLLAVHTIWAHQSGLFSDIGLATK